MLTAQRYAHNVTVPMQTLVYSYNPQIHRLALCLSDTTSDKTVRAGKLSGPKISIDNVSDGVDASFWSANSELPVMLANDVFSEY